MVTVNGMGHDEVTEALLGSKIQLLTLKLALCKDLPKPIAELVGGSAHVLVPLDPKTLRHGAKNLAMPLLQIDQ